MGINVNAIGDILGIAGGAASGASLAISDGVSITSAVVPSPTSAMYDVAALAGGAAAGVAVARSMRWSSVAGAIGGGILGLVARQAVM